MLAGCKRFRCAQMFEISSRAQYYLPVLALIHMIMAIECSNQIQMNNGKAPAVGKVVAVVCTTCGKDTALKTVAKPGPNRFVQKCCKI